MIHLKCFILIVIGDIGRGQHKKRVNPNPRGVYKFTKRVVSASYCASQWTVSLSILITEFQFNSLCQILYYSTWLCYLTILLKCALMCSNSWQQFSNSLNIRWWCIPESQGSITSVIQRVVNFYNTPIVNYLPRPITQYSINHIMCINILLTFCLPVFCVILSVYNFKLLFSLLISCFYFNDVLMCIKMKTINSFQFDSKYAPK